jgi:hypothetical protein
MHNIFGWPKRWKIRYSLGLERGEWGRVAPIGGVHVLCRRMFVDRFV